MKHTFRNHAKRAGVALAALVASVAFATASALAAKPASSLTFASANLSIAAGTGAGETGTAAGGLTCTWRETGLFPVQLITYLCDAAVVGVVEGCVLKNKLVEGSATQVSVFQNPGASLEGGAVGFVSNNSGRIGGTTTTAAPASEGAGGHLCTEPAVAEVVAVRWCNASLTDTVNNLVGATANELFQQFFSGVGEVPSCAELLVSPPSPGGGH